MTTPKKLASAPIATLCAACLLGCPLDGASPAGVGSSKASSSAVGSTTSRSAAAPTTSATTRSKATPPAYKGPTGTLSGTIRIKGDPPPEHAFTYPKECGGAAATYGKLFRVGLEGSTLADAIVAVTKYAGFVAPKQDKVAITIRNCSYSTRSIAVTDGQHIEVKNLDPLTSYVPHLDGARLPALSVAVPRGKSIKLYTRKAGRYWLRDQMGRKFMVAHVFHFRFATTDVTKLDGKYKIEGIPVGKVEVSAMLPAAKLLSTTKAGVQIKAGDNTLDLELVFDAKKHTPESPDGKPKKP